MSSMANIGLFVFSAFVENIKSSSVKVDIAFRPDQGRNAELIRV